MLRLAARAVAAPNVTASIGATRLAFRAARDDTEAKIIFRNGLKFLLTCGIPQQEELRCFEDSRSQAFCFAALPLFAQPAAPTCAKTLGITWADIKQCMQELTVRYPDQFSDAVFGYLPPGTATPIVGFAGTALGNETDYNSVPPKDDKIVWQGSISKVFTHAMTLLAMERAGRSLDNKFGEFNAAAHANFIDGEAYELSKQRKGELTVRQILTMTAGFKEMTYNGLENHHLRGSDPSFWSHFPSATSCFQQATARTDPNQWFLLEPGLYNECMWVPSVIGDPNSAKTWKAGRDVPLWNVAQYMMRYPVTIDPIDPHFPNVYPSNYSNTASIFGAFITESLSGQTFNTYAKTNFFQPLGMNDTFYNPVHPRSAAAGQGERRGHDRSAEPDRAHAEQGERCA